MTKMLRWGILGTARVARNRMIPALIEAERCEPIAIASRNLATARAVADVFGIDRVYGSYIVIPPCNQFAATATSFATAIIDRTDLLLSLDRSIENMQTIEAIFRADRTNTWIELTKYSQ
ncbi:MAG: hypothetical protein RLZZ135_2279 [Cyanobacteriota bacterium]|jgi:predicted dehydrogenase